MLPYLSLKVEGLTEARDSRSGVLELKPGDGAANDLQCPDTTMPTVPLDPDQLDVYGWESNFWSKIKGYLGL